VAVGVGRRVGADRGGAGRRVDGVGFGEEEEAEAEEGKAEEAWEDPTVRRRRHCHRQYSHPCDRIAQKETAEEV